MTVVVADASPLISLAKIQRLLLLKELFGGIVVPAAVYHEAVDRGKDHSESKDIAAADWIRTAEPNNVAAVDGLEKDLGKGEAQAIVLAEELGALLLIDEVRGRRVAERRGLKIKGTLGVLAQARRMGLVSDLRAEFESLRKAGVWISDDILRHIEEGNA